MYIVTLYIDRGGYFFDASYVSIVFVWMMTEVSAFCQYSDLVVIVLVTLHELSPNAIATQVTIAGG